MDDDLFFDAFNADPDELAESPLTMPDSGTNPLLADSWAPELPGAGLDPLHSDPFHSNFDDPTLSPAEPEAGHDLHPMEGPHFGGGGRLGREEPAGILLVAQGDQEDAKEALLEKGIEVKIPFTTTDGDVGIKTP